nr:uncharacterized protein LOC105346744 isoform X2 [Crassostrea gigas]
MSSVSHMPKKIVFSSRYVINIDINLKSKKGYKNLSQRENVPLLKHNTIVTEKESGKMKQLLLLMMAVVCLTHVTCNEPPCYYVCCNASCSVKCRQCFQRLKKRQSPHKRGFIQQRRMEYCCNQI